MRICADCSINFLTPRPSTTSRRYCHSMQRSHLSSDGALQAVSTLVPPPHYTLIETSKGEDPAIVVVNSALRRFDQRDRFPWHLSVLIDCKQLAQNGMPAAEENEALNQTEDEISKLLLERQNALFLARITCRGQRELVFRVNDPEIADQILQELLSAPAPLREWEYRMERDGAWDLARAELLLLEKDPKYS
jgi:hypothetical protein